MTAQRTPARRRFTRRPLSRRAGQLTPGPGEQAQAEPEPAGPGESESLPAEPGAPEALPAEPEASEPPAAASGPSARTVLAPGRPGARLPVIPIGVTAAAILVISAPRLLLRRASMLPLGSPSLRAPRLRVRRLLAPRLRLATVGATATWAVAAATLFVIYLHVARTSAVTSDGASNALQAWDMLHGNPLLRGWQLSDVSFYPTELVQYAAIERLRGLTPDVVHIASAMTYTLLALLAALLAKGRATGRDAIVRCVLAAGIMLAPQLGDGIYVLMGSPDHIGSTVPVMVAFLLLDRAPRRWYTAIAAGLILSAGLVADGIVLYTGIMPVLAICAVRIYRSRFQLKRRWRKSSFELILAAATAPASWLARTALTMIARHGGFRVWPVSPLLATPGDLGRSLAVTGRGLLLLFGASFFSHPAGFVAALAFAHLIGLGLAAWGTCATIRRLGRADLAAALLAAGIVLTLTAYLLSTRADDLASTRDITALLPFGAALAGRALAGRLVSARLVPALAVVLIGYLISLGRLVTEPPTQPDSAALGSWLAAHHLTDGLAGYWNANVTTLDTAGRVSLRSVLANGTRITSDYWEVKSAWFDPAVSDANFIVLVPSPPGFKRYPTVASVRRSFGQPMRIYYVNSYTIVVWNKNLLGDVVRGRPLPPRGNSGTPPATPLPAPPGE